MQRAAKKLNLKPHICGLKVFFFCFFFFFFCFFFFFFFVSFSFFFCFFFFIFCFFFVSFLEIKLKIIIEQKGETKHLWSAADLEVFPPSFSLLSLLPPKKNRKEKINKTEIIK